MSLHRPSASTPRKPLNILANAEVVQTLKDADVNISQVCNAAMENVYRDIKARQWLEENQQAIAALHDFYAEHGSFADKMRAYLHETI
jgi:post-segregation antitoxin (ccd killing protein)